MVANARAFEIDDDILRIGCRVELLLERLDRYKKQGPLQQVEFGIFFLIQLCHVNLFGAFPCEYKGRNQNAY